MITPSPMARRSAVRALALLTAAWLTSHPSPGYADESERTPGVEGADTLPAPPRVWLSGGLHGAFLSDVVDGSWQGLTFGVEAKAGLRASSMRAVGGFLQLDVAHWFGPEVARADSDRPFAASLQVALNIGVGIDVLYFGARMRGAFSAGPSVLLRDNAVGHAGAVGVFVDFRPMGVRVVLPRGATLVVDPLTFTAMLPDLSAIPLLQIEYRTVLAIEFGVGGQR